MRPPPRSRSRRHPLSPLSRPLPLTDDLPNRDCNAKASAGEIQGATSAALREYKYQYVEPFAEKLAKYSRVPVVLVIEPDSLGNVISNVGKAGCSQATVDNYKEGVKYAIQTLAAKAPHAGLYVDAAHGGWMGYQQNSADFVTLMHSMGVLPLIRGFSTNVANYQALGLGSICPKEAFVGTGQKMFGTVGGIAEWCKKTPAEGGGKGSKCCQTDPCSLLTLGSGGATELTYAQSLQQHFVAKTGWAPHFVIDTGRNGAEPDPRGSCRSWCNIRNAGAGHAPTTNTGLPSVVDAFFWLKTPGESDGCTAELPSGGKCARFDPSCAGVDSIGAAAGEPRAPEAGGWFEYQARMLAKHAQLHLDLAGTMYKGSPGGSSHGASSDEIARRPVPTTQPPPPPPTPAPTQTQQFWQSSPPPPPTHHLGRSNDGGMPILLGRSSHLHSGAPPSLSPHPPIRYSSADALFRKKQAGDGYAPIKLGVDGASSRTPILHFPPPSSPPGGLDDSTPGVLDGAFAALGLSVGDVDVGGFKVAASDLSVGLLLIAFLMFYLGLRRRQGHPRPSGARMRTIPVTDDEYAEEQESDRPRSAMGRTSHPAPARPATRAPAPPPVVQGWRRQECDSYEKPRHTSEPRPRTPPSRPQGRPGAGHC